MCECQKKPIVKTADREVAAGSRKVLVHYQAADGDLEKAERFRAESERDSSLDHDFVPKPNDSARCHVCMGARDEHQHKTKDCPGEVPAGVCPTCHGEGAHKVNDLAQICTDCGGSGKAVPQPVAFDSAFTELENKLKGQPGVTDPAGLAAWIGQKKYGVAGMAKLAAAGRAGDSIAEVPAHGFVPDPSKPMTCTVCDGIKSSHRVKDAWSQEARDAIAKVALPDSIAHDDWTPEARAAAAAARKAAGEAKSDLKERGHLSSYESSLLRKQLPDGVHRVRKVKTNVAPAGREPQYVHETEYHFQGGKAVQEEGGDDFVVHRGREVIGTAPSLAHAQEMAKYRAEA